MDGDFLVEIIARSASVKSHYLGTVREVND